MGMPREGLKTSCTRPRRGLALNYETVSMGTPLPNIRRRELAGKKSGKLFCVFSVFTNAKFKETTGMLRSVTLA